MREKLLNDFRDQHGPFDVIGDVHGCRSELEALLDELGYELVRDEQGRPVDAVHPEAGGRVFVGDLVDRGPDSPGVLRLVMGMVARRPRALRAGQPREQAGPRAAAAATCRSATASPRRSTQLAAETEEFRKAGRGRSATAWSRTWCSTTAGWSSRTPG